jgi:hypothetical protein
MVVMTWLIPITDAKASYVRLQGWPTFEETLAAEDSNLADLSRRTVTAAVGLERVAHTELGAPGVRYHQAGKRLVTG